MNAIYCMAVFIFYSSYFLSACPKHRQEMLKHIIVITMATGIQGISFIWFVSRFAASFPYSDVIT